MEFIETNKQETEKAAWLEKRKHYVTGTDAAKLLGISPFGSIFDVWLDKTGQAPEFAQNEAMKWGSRLERDILKAYAEETDSRLEHMDGYDLKTCDKYPRLGASLDGWNHTLGIPVDAKNIRWKNEKWGAAYSSEFPDYYKTQLQVQMMVTGARYAHLAVLFSGQEFAVYYMEYDEELAKSILDASDAFWPYVEHNEMPEVSGSATASEFISGKFAVGDENKEKEADEQVAGYVKAYVEATAAENAAKAAKDEAGNRIKAWLGEATVCPGFCTWKNNKYSQKTDWEAVASELLAGLTPEQKADIIGRHTAIKAGNRTLRITAKGF